MGLFSFARKRSIWTFCTNTGSCNACDAELLAAFGPRYDAERLGAKLVASPKHADLLVVTGPVTAPCKEPFLRIHDMIPEPRVVMALGTCAISGHPFTKSPTVVGPAEKFMPIDLKVVGCPPKPQAILDAILAAADLLSRGGAARQNGQEPDRKQDRY